MQYFRFRSKILQNYKTFCNGFVSVSNANKQLKISEIYFGVVRLLVLFSAQGWCLARWRNDFGVDLAIRRSTRNNCLAGLGFPYFSLSCYAVNFDFLLILINSDFILCYSNFDFILYYNLLLCFIQLEMHVRLICAIKFYLFTYLLNSRDRLPGTGGRGDATTPRHIHHYTPVKLTVSSKSKKTFSRFNRPRSEGWLPYGR